MLSLATAALLEMGVERPDRHLFVATGGRIANLIVSRSPFSETDLKALHRAAEEYEFAVLLAPDAPAQSDVLRNILQATSREQLDRSTSGLDLDLSPPTDDRPFFFNQFPFDHPARALKLTREMYGKGGYGGVYEGNLVATGTLLILLVVAAVLVVLTIVVPLRPAIKDVGGGLAAGGTLYFMLIGIGFMMTEIGLLQRASVFLGHPMYSLSILLFTLILTTGLGSLLSERFPLNDRGRFAGWAIIVGAYILVLPAWLPTLFLALDGSSLSVRAAACVLAVAPAGIMMGFGFPTGMRLISAIDNRPTPWFWGINGAAGVLASVIAVACSIAFGISTTITLGGLCYLFLIPVTLVLMSSGFPSKSLKPLMTDPRT
jgi:hypothetical protein